MEGAAALCALAALLLVHDSLARGPHCALLDAAVDGGLGLLCGSLGEWEAALQVTFVDIDVEVCLGGRGGVHGGVHGAAGVWVLVEGREGVRRVEGHVLFIGGRR